MYSSSMRHNQEGDICTIPEEEEDRDNENTPLSPGHYQRSQSANQRPSVYSTSAPQGSSSSYAQRAHPNPTSTHNAPPQRDYSSMPYGGSTPRDELATRSLDVTPRQRVILRRQASRKLSRTASQLAPQASFIVSGDFSRQTASLRQESLAADHLGPCTPCLPARVDGGWAWVVMVAAFFMILLVDGIAFSVPVLLDFWKTEFNVGDTQVSLISSFITGTYLLAGPIASTLTEFLGFRPMAIAGSLVAAIGLLIASFARNIPTMVVTYGLMGGFGCCFLYVTAMVGTSLYFEKWRSIAVGFMACGSGVGVIVFSLLISYLLNDVQLGWRHCVRIQAGCFALGSILAATFLPLPRSPGANGERRSFLKALKSAFDISLFKDVVFWLLMLAAFTAIFGLLIPLQFLAVTGLARGLTKGQSDLLVTVQGISNAVGRLLIGLFVYFVPLHPLLVLSVGLLAGGAIICCAIFYQNIALLFMFAAVLGVIFALDAALATVIIARTLGTEKLSGAFGLLCLARGIAATISGPAGGALQAKMNNFDGSYYLAGAVIAFTGLVSFVNWIISRRREFDMTDIEPTGPEDDNLPNGPKAETAQSPLLEPTSGNYCSRYGTTQFSPT